MASERIVFFDYHGVLTDGSLASLTEPPHERFVTEEARTALRNLRSYVLIIISNQVGVARGDFTEADLIVGVRHLKRDLLNIGVRIETFLYCPHHPCARVPAFHIECTCRKPSPFYVLKSLGRFQAHPAQAAFVGDTIETDMECALSAGVIPVLLGTHDPATVPAKVLCARDLAEAALLVRRELPPPAVGGI
jgi:D-glycero-D-manno-heptose 1,7-bisphosphate phosphatase